MSNTVKKEKKRIFFPFIMIIIAEFILVVMLFCSFILRIHELYIILLSLLSISIFVMFIYSIFVKKYLDTFVFCFFIIFSNPLFVVREDIFYEYSAIKWLWRLINLFGIFFAALYAYKYYPNRKNKNKDSYRIITK